MDDAVVIIGGVLVLGVLAALLVKVRGGSAGAEPSPVGNRYKTSGADRMVREGRPAEAAGEAMKAKNWDEAVDLYRLAAQPANAAHAARRAGKPKQAAELFEMAGDKEQAAACWEEAGVFDRADELRGKAEQREEQAFVHSDNPIDVSLPSEAPVSEAEASFRKAQAEAVGDPAAKAKVQELAREAADKLLAAGEMRRAAEVFRDAGLHDEAIHLFVNVLGAPGEAAPLLSARGNHGRAAELYEMAGEIERAASAWVEVARDSDKPDSYIDRIESLSEEVAFNFLDLETKTRAPSEETAELHYRLALLSEKRGDRERAHQVLTVLVNTVGSYKNSHELLRGMPLVMPPSGAGATLPSPTAETVASAPAKGLPASPDAETSVRGEKPDQQRRGGYSFVSDKPDAGVATISDDELQELVLQASMAAAEQLRHVEVVQKLGAGGLVSDRRTRRQKWWGGELPTLLAVGIEEEPVKLELLSDDSVRATHAGPSISELLAYVEGAQCDLGNIEVFYRLGMAYLGKGLWSEALDAFAQVEEASPGYRDAEKRSMEIQAWQKALGKRRSTLGMMEGKPHDRTQGRYGIEGELGRGGMAVVYRAHDNVLGRNVALKFMAEEVSQRNDLREMFQREARAAASLNHPSIVTIFDYGMLEDRAFICMELVDGMAVDELQDKLTIVESLQIAKQALDALGYAHQRKIVHRDIKPANMMRTTTGLVKLMDFGLAKPLDSKRAQSLIAGTPAFMPPEQLAGEDVDHRADIFALGVTLYELLTRELPFDGLNRSRTPASPAELVPAIPAVVADAVMRAIEPDREARWPSAEAFAAPLQSVIDAVGRFASNPPPASRP